MTDYSNLAVYQVNKFVTAKLREQNIIPLEADYITQVSNSSMDIPLSFITPAQQSPEQTTMFDTNDVEGFTDLPFINYTISYKAEPDMPWMNCGQVSYIVYTQDIDKLLEIGNYIVDLCKREDYSAADINHFLVSDTSNKFLFTTMSVLNAGGPMESESEGGRYGFMIVISFDYLYQNPVAKDINDTSFSNGQAMWS